MILNPKFYEPLAIDRTAARTCLGLEPAVSTGLVLFGGEGSTEMLRIAIALNRPGKNLQLILPCGKNAEVAAKLRAALADPSPHRRLHARCSLLHGVADFFIGKPGPGSISEALAKRLPVIVQRNAWTMVHERYNADWIEEQGVGLVVRKFSSEIASAVDTLLAPDNYARFRQRAAAIQNQAVYEVPGLMDRILSESNRSRRDRESGSAARFRPDTARSA